MAENLEAFVKKLQSEGVEAGREAAEQLKKEAENQAAEILDRARAEADEIRQKAEEEAARRRRQTQAELDMAVRDILLRLRKSLSRALGGLIIDRVGEHLADRDYLRDIIREVVTAYARSDAAREGKIAVEVSKELPDEWIQSLIKGLSDNLQKSGQKTDVKAILSRAGFDYRVEDATVEVSPDSITEVLLEMVNPELQEIITRALEESEG